MRPIGRPEGDGEMPDLRWNWDTPVLLSAHDDNTVYIGGNRLFRSTDLGQSFEAISGDLTWAIDRDTLTIMGVPGGEAQMSRNDGQSSYGNLTAIAESPRDAAVLYTGADDGRLHVTRDGGATWTDITDRVPDLPDYAYVTRIVASHGDPGTVFVAFDNHRNDDFAAYLYRSENFGRDWTRITDGLPVSSLSALAQHPDNPRLLFAGNEVGVFVSANAGAGWARMEGGLPTVPVDDIKIHPRDNDLIIGTHGRGIWILDDIGPLEHLTPAALTAAAHVFPVRRATSYNLYTPQGWTPGIYAAPNPPAGARIRYHLAADTDDLEMRIIDATGNHVRTLDAPSQAGMHELVWDLRLEELDGDGESLGNGPRVLPGAYIVEMTTGAEIIQTEIPVRMDPRAELGRRDLMVRHQAMMESYRLSGATDAAEEAIDEMRDRLDDVEELLADRMPEDLGGRVEALRGSLDEAEEALDDASDGAGAWRGIEGSGAMPTADALFQIERSWELLPAVLDRINGVINGEYNAILRSVYTPTAMPQGPSPVEAPSRGG